MQNMPLQLFRQVTAALVESGHQALATQIEAFAPPEELLSSTQAARLLGVSSSNTIKNWLKGGFFPGAFQTPGGHWRFPKSEVDRVRHRLLELQAKNLHRAPEPPELEDDTLLPPLL